MERSIDDNIRLVLRILAEKPCDSGGYSWISGQELQNSTGLSPAEINDAVTILRESGTVEVL
ncbi:hypothetical protein MUP79_04200 [Candidatus Bathyarchaeota archaeon]|nr:hypothetical protein [Candidatus Bathyarchaeota archaeon]